MRLAGEERPEVTSARERAAAASFRITQVGALDDPMVMAAIDHLPVSFMGVNTSVMVEQTIPLSRIRGHRVRAAEAEMRRLRAMARSVALDVELEAVMSLLMVHETRRTREVVVAQQALARQLVAAAHARYAAGQGNQAEVLRAETELARLDSEEQALKAEIAAAEAMLRSSLGRPAGEAIPALAVGVKLAAPPDARIALRRAERRRPEIAAMRAEIARAQAEIGMMKSMYSPMARFGLGGAYTMEDGPGFMAIIGISIPLWRGKLSAGVAEAQAMERMARADLAAMERMIEGEVRAAHESTRAWRIRVVTLRDDVLPRARQSVEASLASYGAAQVPLIAVIDALQAQWSVEEALVRAEVTLEITRARLRRSMGVSRESR
jgi:outer membrane protein TolC